MKYICLDIGNVLCTITTAPFLEYLSETFNITLPEATRFLRRFQQAHDLGLTTIEDELKDHFDVKSTMIMSKLMDLWSKIVAPHMGMITKLNDLRVNNNLQVALLSNIGVEHAFMMEHVLENGGFFQNSIKHFSCEVGARKPSKLFYQSFLSQHPEFNGSLYVDDLTENLEASKQFGFQTFHMSLDQSDVGSKILEIEQLVIS